MSAACRHHPDRAAAGTCANCRGGYCSDCLAPLQHQLYCAYCREERLIRLQAGRGAAGEDGLERTARLSLNVGIVALALLFVATFLNQMRPGLAFFAIMLLAFAAHVVARIAKWLREGLGR